MAVAGFASAPIVVLATKSSSAVIYSTFAVLAVVIGYDTFCWVPPAHWQAALRHYEHVHKSMAPQCAMLSATSGNVIRSGQP